MHNFDELFEMAALRKGGAASFEASLPEIKPARDLVKISDDRWLAAFSKGVFQTGLNWKVVENKWDGIEEALWGFDIGRCKMMSDDDLDVLLKDTRVIRHAQKLLSVRDNAVFFAELAQEFGSAARAFAEWPNDDFIGLMALLKKRGSRIGGNTGMYALRIMGRDGFVLGGDVVKALVREGVVDKTPTSMKALIAVQDAFNTWAAESGRSLAAISRTLACTVD